MGQNKNIYLVYNFPIVKHSYRIIQKEVIGNYSRERQRMTLNEKSSQDSMFMGDEDEGSPSQGGAYPLPLIMVAGEDRQISGSPLGEPSPDHLSLRT